MEIKENLKQDIKIKVASIIITVCLCAFLVSALYGIWAIGFIAVALVAQNLFEIVSVVILVGMLIFIMYEYIYKILKYITEMKMVKAVLMLILLIATIAGIIILHNKFLYNEAITTKNIIPILILMILSVLSVIILPVVVLGISLFNKGKLRRFFIIVSLVLLVAVYAGLYSPVINIVQICIETAQIYFSNDSAENEETQDVSYLENYKQKFAQNGYLEKYDVQNILNIANSKSMEIKITYKDESSDINMEFTNKDDSTIEELIENLKSNYYIFAYDLENNKVTINIETYIVSEDEDSEKNEDIIINGTKNSDIINNVKDNETYLYATNEIILEPKQNIQLDSLKVLFAYDSDEENYVPVVEDEEEYRAIKSYTVSGSLLKIVLEDGVSLKDTDYTLRINRYTDNLAVSESKSSYYYEYEPVVLTSYSGDNISLLIEFPHEWSIESLKNIEIIFN